MSEVGKRTVSAHLILSEHKAGSDPEELRAELLADGVAKGTACKIVTVLKGLYAGTIRPKQVTSLNRAYALVTVSAQLQDAVSRVRQAAEGDSNDEEIEALQDALSIALGLLGFPEEEHHD